MKLSLEQLQRQQTLLPIYLIASESLFLRDEALSIIRHQAQQQHYDEHLKLTITKADDWQAFYEQSNALSLFAQKRLIELHCDSKPSQRLIDPFTHYCQNPINDLCVVLVCSKLDKALMKKHWFQAIDQNGGIALLYPPKPHQFPNWLQQRLQAAGLHIDADALQLLTNLTQGNLLAANQAIQRLQLLQTPNQSIDYKTVLTSCDNASYFDVFKLADACLQGQQQTAQAALTKLQADQTEPLIILWALAKDIRSALAIIEDCQINKMSAHQSLQNNKIWQNRQPLFKNLLQTASIDLLKQYLQLCAHIDLAAKGATHDDPQCLLAHLIDAISLRQTPIFPQQQWLNYGTVY